MLQSDDCASQRFAVDARQSSGAWVGAQAMPFMRAFDPNQSRSFRHVELPGDAKLIG